MHVKIYQLQKDNAGIHEKPEEGGGNANRQLLNLEIEIFLPSAKITVSE